MVVHMALELSLETKVRPAAPSGAVCRVLQNGAPFPYLPNVRARISHDSSAATITIKVAKNQDLKTLLRPSFRVMEQQQKFSVTSASNEMQFHLFSLRLLVD